MARLINDSFLKQIEDYVKKEAGVSCKIRCNETVYHKDKGKCHIELEVSIVTEDRRYERPMAIEIQLGS